MENFEKILHPKHYLLVQAKSILTMYYGATFTKTGTHVTDMKNISLATLKKAEGLYLIC